MKKKPQAKEAPAQNPADVTAAPTEETAELASSRVQDLKEFAQATPFEADQTAQMSETLQGVGDAAQQLGEGAEAFDEAAKALEQTGQAQDEVQPEPEEAPKSKYEFDPDLLYAEDADGNPISDEEAGKYLLPQMLQLPFGQQKHRVEVELGNVGLAVVVRVQRVGINLVLEAGYKPGEEVGPGSGEEEDPRFARLNELTANSQELLDAYADLAAVATTRDEKGRARTSIPELREELTGAKLRGMGSLGELYIRTVQEWWQAHQ